MEHQSLFQEVRSWTHESDAWFWTPSVEELEEFQNEFQNITSSGKPAIPPPSSGGVSTVECVLLTIFGTLVAIFFIFQMTIYVRYCSARRQSWSIKKKRVCLGVPNPGVRTDAIWAHMYEPYGSVPCKPGLKYSSRPNGMVYMSDFDSGSDTRSDKSFIRGTADSRSTFSSTVFMVDPRGHFSPRLSASPEVAMELLGSSKTSSKSSLCGVGLNITEVPMPGGSPCPPPVPERCGSLGRVRSPLSIPYQCENPAYESDVSTCRSYSSPSCGLTTEDSDGAHYYPTTEDSDGSHYPTSPTTNESDTSSDSSFTSISSMSDVSALPAIMATHRYNQAILNIHSKKTGSRYSHGRP